MWVVFGFRRDGRRARFARLPLETRPRSRLRSLSDHKAVDSLSISTAAISRLLLLKSLYPRLQSRHVLLLLLAL